MTNQSVPKSLILVVDPTSGRIQAAQLVSHNWAPHEFNRLIDHFQLGCSGLDSLQPISDTFVIQVRQTKPGQTC